MKKIDVLKHEIKHLSFPRKITLSASLLSLLFLFLPWGTRGVQNETTFEFASESFSAFGIFSVFGWLLLLLIATTLFLLWREMLSKRVGSFGITHSTLWVISGGIGIYTIVIALFVLSSTYLKSFDSQFSLKFGIFFTLFMQALVLFSGLLGRKDDEKSYLKESLSHPSQVDTSRAHLAPETAEPEEQMSLGDYDH